MLRECSRHEVERKRSTRPLRGCRSRAVASASRGASRVGSAWRPTLRDEVWVADTEGRTSRRRVHVWTQTSAGLRSSSRPVRGRRLSLTLSFWTILLYADSRSQSIHGKFGAVAGAALFEPGCRRQPAAARVDVVGDRRQFRAQRVPPPAELTGVSCPTTTACFVVGKYTAGAPGMFAESWNGTSLVGSSEPEPLRLRKRFRKRRRLCDCDILRRGGLSGPVGRNATPRRSSNAGTERVGRSSRARMSSTNTRLQAVSCTSTTDCTAVGFDSTSTVGEPSSSDGTERAWSIVRDTGPPQQLRRAARVSCVTSTNCVAVGLLIDSQTFSQSPLAEQVDGVAWSQIPSPPGPLAGLACLAVADFSELGQPSSTGRVELDDGRVRNEPLRGVVFDQHRLPRGRCHDGALERSELVDGGRSRLRGRVVRIQHPVRAVNSNQVMETPSHGVGRVGVVDRQPGDRSFRRRQDKSYCSSRTRRNSSLCREAGRRVGDRPHRPVPPCDGVSINWFEIHRRAPGAGCARHGHVAVICHRRPTQLRSNAPSWHRPRGSRCWSKHDTP